MKPDKKQQKTFLEWCGFKYVFGETLRTGEFTEQNYYWNAPTGRRCKELPPIDLNNLFKYAIPKLEEKDIAWELHSTRYGWTLAKLMWNEKAFWKFTNLKVSIKVDKDPSLALFWVIWEVAKMA